MSRTWYVPGSTIGMSGGPMSKIAEPRSFGFSWRRFHTNRCSPASLGMTSGFSSGSGRSGSGLSGTTSSSLLYVRITLPAPSRTSRRTEGWAWASW